MAVKNDMEAIWELIPGAAPLKEIYGYWPTLHDAVIREMNFDFASRSVEVILDYNDNLVDDATKDINTRIAWVWRGISESKLRLYDGALYGIEFAHKEGLIETQFVDYPWGMDGYLLSDSVEVLSVELAPDVLSQNDHEIRLWMK